MSIEYVEKLVRQPKETTELAELLEVLVVEAVKASREGFKAGTHIPAILAASAGKLMTALEGIDKLDEEWADQAGFLRVWANAGANIFEAVKALSAPAPTD